MTPLPPGYFVGQFAITHLMKKNRLGHVYKASKMDEKKQEIVAIKFDFRKKNNGNEYENNMMLQGSPHFPTVVAAGVAFDNQYFGTVMEGPDFETLLERYGTFDHSDTLLFAIHATVALQELHTRGIIHGDVKIDNFVLGASPKKSPVVLIDLGSSRRFDSSTRNFSSPNTAHRQGQRSDPVVVRGGKYSDSCDMFGLLYCLRRLSGYKTEWHALVNARDTYEERAKIIEEYCTQLQFSLVPEDIPFYYELFKALYNCGGRGKVPVNHLEVINVFKTIDNFNPDAQFSFIY